MTQRFTNKTDDTAEIAGAVDYGKILFEAFGMQNVLAGWVVDGTAIVRYDRTGGFTPAGNSLFQGADPDAWMPIDDSFRQ